MGKLLLIVILGAIITFGISNISLNKYVSGGLENSVDDYSYHRAHDIASSMVDVILMRMVNDTKYRVESSTTEDLDGGSATYTAENVFFEGDSLVKVSVTGKYNGAEKSITAHTARPDFGWVPPFIRAAWTANGNLNNTISDMFIDGRDHDLNLNIIPKTGRFGVSTSVTFVNTQNAAIGGTKDSIDYPMTYPENPDIIEEYDWGGTFPDSPDKVLGYPEGTLKKVAQSGINGSQYLLNPDNATLWDPKKKKWKKTKFIDGLTYPVSGVTYIEITNSGIKQEIQFEQNGNSGIFVVHGPNCGSRIDGVKFDKNTSDGLFTGLLVTDYSFHHHLDILGGVIQLSPDLETSKNCNGNKDHWVYYSSEAISNATKITTESGLVGNNPTTNNFGFATQRLTVKYWFE